MQHSIVGSLLTSALCCWRLRLAVSESKCNMLLVQMLMKLGQPYKTVDYLLALEAK